MGSRRGLEGGDLEDRKGNILGTPIPLPPNHYCYYTSLSKWGKSPWEPSNYFALFFLPGQDSSSVWAMSGWRCKLWWQRRLIFPKSLISRVSPWVRVSQQTEEIRYTPKSWNHTKRIRRIIQISAKWRYKKEEKNPYKKGRKITPTNQKTLDRLRLQKNI